jgi:Flp pilus assembly protein TadD/TolB-like protein
LKRLFMTCLLVFLLATVGRAQSVSTTSQTILVLPFENASKAPGLEWIGESFPEILEERMKHAGMYVVPRADRTYAFDRAGIPANLRPSHATLYLIGEQMDVDYMVLGHYAYDGQVFTARAQLLDVKRLRLSPPVTESGQLTALIDIQKALAWGLMRGINPAYQVSRNEFIAGSPPVRLDAFEAYIRGITATNRPEKIRKFREALQVNPTYTQAMMQLGRTYFAAREYESAASWFNRVPRTDPAAREANFYAGLAYYYSGEYERAENALGYVASLFPLTEIYNNLGVVAARRGRKSAADYFRKAVQADDNDSDYRFNLGLTLYKSGDDAGAARQLREAVRLQPSDVEAKALLDSVSLKTDGNNRPRLPAERIKLNYDETSFRQLALEIQKTTEARLAKSDPRTHAAYHVEHGHELLQQGFIAEAGAEFREAVSLDPANANAHAGLAAVLEASNDPAGARREAATALQLQPSVEAYLVTAKVDLHDNKPQAAAANVDLALRLEPANAAAIALKRSIAAKIAEKAQP